MLLERAPFSSSAEHLSTIPTSLRSLKNLGANDIYFWFMAASGSASAPDTSTDLHEDLKINLICPAPLQMYKKYSKQGAHMVIETPKIYAEYIRPFIQRKREMGSLNWCWNIIDGKTEAEDVIYRTVKGIDVERGFLLLPDLNWDRKTMESLHLLGLVERMDIWSLRDLKKKHIGWLKDMRQKIVEATVKTYPELEEDQLKMYVHYQPTYYHFHIHIVHVKLEAGATQAVGKAIGLESILSQLETMAGDQETGMDSVSLNYAVGSETEIWTEIFEPLKKNGKASQPQEQGR
jgi:m7GpppX diphosphatase